MSKPNDYLLNSDYSSLANSADYEVRVAISGTIAAGTAKEFFEVLVTEDDYPALQAQVATTSESGKTYIIGQFARFDRSGSTPMLPTANYSLHPSFNHSAPTVASVGFTVNNPYGETLTLVSETFTFYLKGFVTPYAEGS